MRKDDKYIDVVIGLGADKTFTYSLPEGLREKAAPGHRVIVPLGKKTSVGFIVRSLGGVPGFAVKDILDLPDDAPLIPAGLMELTRWVASYYHAPWGMALASALPPGIDEGRPSRPRSVEEPAHAGYPSASEITPNQAQAYAVKAVTDAVEEGGFRPFLLHGTTGSGKTEVYLRAIDRLRGAGLGAVVLVPEIALTPQLVRRFRSRFGSSVAVMHSGLTESKRRAEWRKIRSGEAGVAVGARSAVFAPFERIGLIIVDEEHDSSYKQEEGVRYHARDVAVMRAKLAGCPVVLGSATPSVESYHNALKGRYTLLELPERAGGRPMPAVTVVDLRAYPGVALTPPLIEAAKQRLENGEQALFFLNRRGYSDFLICRDCGHVPKCPSCSVSLTFHKSDKSLVCHWCGDGQRPEPVCPNCGGARIRYVGGGTEKLEGEIQALFPDVGVTRLDRDTVKRRGSYERLLGEVESGATSVLLGTQMVAKGHDIARIGLVGVVSADYGLNMPDFRAAERVFQTLTQVTGRSGRGDTPGESIIQTYQPDHYAITFAASGDYRGFFDVESVFRKELGYPPYTRMVMLTFKGVKEEKAKGGADAAGEIFTRLARGGKVEVLGPAPAPVKRVRGKYRFRLVLKSANTTALHKVLDAGLKALEEAKALPGCTVEVDVDPQGMA